MPDTQADPDDNWHEQLLDFWFREHGRADWFGGGAAFDAKVTPAFQDWWEQLQSLPADHFLASQRTALAGVILFDQAPRNMFRGTAEAFATDTLALAIAKAAIERGFDAGLPDDEALFFYLPFEHSEDLDDQRESLRLFAALGNAEYLAFAQKHFDVVERYGRFPHRNAMLGRQTRPEEQKAVEEGLAW